jgi:hypothetical protein
MKNLTWLADSRSNVKSFPAGDLRDPRLPEEVQGWDRDAEAGDGPYPAAAQTVAT